MGKRTKKCPKTCQKHKFILKPVHYSAVFSRELEASYCPAHQTAPSIMPKFNKDKKHFTSGFFLPVDQKRLLANDSLYRNEHERYKLENINEKSQILVAKPRAKYSYCSVCKTDYDDYMGHIKSETHTSKLQNNKFDGYINQLCSQLQQHNEILLHSQQESLFSETVDNKLLSWSQETLSIEAGMLLKSNPSVATSPDYRQSKDWLHTFKTFHMLPQHNDHHLMMMGEDQFAVPTNPPFSPHKKYSEVSEGVRQVCPLKPIILCGGKTDLNI